MPLLVACDPVTYGEVVIASADRIDTACSARSRSNCEFQLLDELQAMVTRECTLTGATLTVQRKCSARSAEWLGDRISLQKGEAPGARYLVTANQPTISVRLPQHAVTVARL